MTNKTSKVNVNKGIKDVNKDTRAPRGTQQKNTSKEAVAPEQADSSQSSAARKNRR